MSKSYRGVYTALIIFTFFALLAAMAMAALAVYYLSTAAG
jgi:hypothetical protein